MDHIASWDSRAKHSTAQCPESARVRVTNVERCSKLLECIQTKFATTALERGESKHWLEQKAPRSR